MSESALWEWLRGYLPRGHFTRIETGDTGPGTPDVYYRLGPKHNGFLELKFSHFPTSKYPFRPDSGVRKSQEIWITDEINLGGLVWVVAEVGIGPRVLFIHGKHVKRINHGLLTDLIDLADLVLYRNKVKYADVKRLKKLLQGEHRA